jgi:putative ABC transport system ATP-binding protein
VSAPIGPKPVLDVRNLTKVYGEGEATVHALRGVSAVVERGDYVAIMGSSGSGKSTLMNIVGCLDVPSAGRYLLDGVDVSRLNENQLALVRNRRIGFVFQAFNLIPRTSAVANVELPMAYAGVKSAERRRRALAALDLVGLAGRADHEPNQLSGGQQQRVAVARALVTEPALVLADEPTGNLDSRSTEDLLAIFDQLSAAGRTIVLITHEPEVGDRAKRLIKLFDGRISSDVRQDGAAAPSVGGWDGAPRGGRLEDQQTIQMERLR